MKAKILNPEGKNIASHSLASHSQNRSFIAVEHNDILREYHGTITLDGPDGKYKIVLDREAVEDLFDQLDVTRNEHGG